MRYHQLHSRWDEQLPTLIDAYLEFKLHECDNLYPRNLNPGDTVEQFEFQILYIDAFGSLLIDDYPHMTTTLRTWQISLMLVHSFSYQGVYTLMRISCGKVV
jgi:hypothetical protein